MDRHDVEFYHCRQCGFLQCDPPHWIEEAYESAIAVADTGLVQRNQFLSNIAAVLLYSSFPADAKFLDIAGGYGLFVRMMRDIGFDFFWADKYCENLLARGFEGVPGGRYEVVTAFEVLEHVSDPVGFIRDALESSGSDSILFSTELFEGDPPAPGQWWYYAFEEGQHVSFYQRRTLQEIAGVLGLRLYSHGSVHMLSKRRLRRWLFALAANRRIARVLALVARLGMRSRTMSDHLAMIRRD